MKHFPTFSKLSLLWFHPIFFRSYGKRNFFRPNSLQRFKLGESGESLYISASSGSCFDGSITQHGSITLDSNISLSEDIKSNSHNEETNIESISSDKEGNNVNNNTDGTKMRKSASNDNNSNNSCYNKIMPWDHVRDFTKKLHIWARSQTSKSTSYRER